MKTQNSEAIKLLILSCWLMSISLIVQTITIPSLPAISQSLNTSKVFAQSSLLACLLGIGFSQFFYGPLSDRVGRRRAVFFGLGICFIGNLWSYFVTSDIAFLLSRLLAGIGAGACPVVTRASLCDIYEGTKLTRAINILSLPIIMSPAISAMIGGYLQTLFGWQASFIFLSTYTLLCLIFCTYYMRESMKQKPIEPFSLCKIVHTYKEIFSHVPFLSYALISTIIFSSAIIYSMVSPFILQNIMGISAFENGFLYSIIALGYITGSFLLDRSLIIAKENKILIVGLLIFTLSGGLFIPLHLAFPLSTLSIIIPITINAISSGMVAPIASKYAMQLFKETAGTAAAALGILRSLGAFLAGIIIGCLSIKSTLGLSYIIIMLGILSFILCGICQIHVLRKHESLVFK